MIQANQSPVGSRIIDLEGRRPLPNIVGLKIRFIGGGYVEVVASGEKRNVGEHCCHLISLRPRRVQFETVDPGCRYKNRNPVVSDNRHADGRSAGKIRTEVSRDVQADRVSGLKDGRFLAQSDGFDSARGWFLSSAS